MGTINQSVLDGFNVLNKQLNKKDFHSEILGKVLDDLNPTNDSKINWAIKTIVDDCLCLSTEDMAVIRNRLFTKANLTYIELIVLGLCKINLCVIGVGEFGSMNEVDETIIEDGVGNFKIGMVSFIASRDAAKENLLESLKEKLKVLLKLFGANPINYGNIGGTTFAFK